MPHNSIDRCWRSFHWPYQSILHVGYSSTAEYNDSWSLWSWSCHSILLWLWLYKRSQTDKEVLAVFRPLRCSFLFSLLKELDSIATRTTFLSHGCHGSGQFTIRSSSTRGNPQLRESTNSSSHYQDHDDDIAPSDDFVCPFALVLQYLDLAQAGKVWLCVPIILEKGFLLMTTRCLFNSDGRFHQMPWMSKCSWLDLLQVAAISYSAVIYRSMLLKLQLLCVKAQFIIALNQHILGRHIWDVPISMNSNSSVQVKESLRPLEWQFTMLT